MPSDVIPWSSGMSQARPSAQWKPATPPHGPVSSETNESSPATAVRGGTGTGLHVKGLAQGRVVRVPRAQTSFSAPGDVLDGSPPWQAATTTRPRSSGVILTTSTLLHGDQGERTNAPGERDLAVVTGLLAEDGDPQR